MFKFNLLFVLKNYKRHKGSFLINLAGLSSGLACALLIYFWVNDELSVDKFYEKESQLYQVMEHMVQSYGVRTINATSGPMAEALLSEMPEVEYATTTGEQIEDAYLSLREKNIQANGHYVSQDYFKVFTHPFIHGSREQALSDKNSIVISEELAEKLFGTTDNILGKTIEFQREKFFSITGIFETLPSNATEKLDFALSYELYEELHPDVLSWRNTGSFVYLILKPGSSVEQFNDKIKDYIVTKTENKTTNRTPFIKRYSEKYLYGRYEDGVQAGGRIEYVKLFSIIAVFIVAIACINFMSLSTARASKRAKEVGVKKSLGATRNALIFQYLSESVLITLFSVILAVLFVLFFLPQFNEIMGKELSFNIDLKLVSVIIGITLFTGLAAGSYPALYLSGFSPAEVLKGKLKKGGQIWVRKGLVIFQFMISMILIVFVLVVYKQIEFTRQKDLGFNRDNIVWMKREGKLLDGENLETFISEVKNIPGVISASSMRHNMAGHVWGAGGLTWEGKDPEDKTEFEVVAINHDMIKMLDIELLEGRTFSREFGLDWKNLIFNETAIDYMGMSDPVGKTIKGWGFNDRQIIGVAKDFHFESFHENIKPLVFMLWPARTDRVMVKIEGGKEYRTIEAMEEFYLDQNPGYSMNYKFLDQSYEAQYVAERRIATLSYYFTGLAILISCLGLFALAAFTAERRIKEISIRKIIGSSNWSIIYLLSKDFTKTALIAVVIGLPISYMLTNNWLDGFAFRIALNWQYFVGPGAMIIAITWLTIGFHMLKTSEINPVDSLKDE